MKRFVQGLLVLVAALGLPRTALASDGHGVSLDVWLALGLILLAAKFGGELAIRWGQPAVLGELLTGVLLGNSEVLGVSLFARAFASTELAFAAELGVILLLFEVGMESSVKQMREVAGEAGAVAVLGVAVPFALGFLASRLLMPNEPSVLHLFVGATLSATSVGVTARVIKDLGASDLREARVILGAAVLDDVLGLVVLAVVTSVAVAGGAPTLGQLARISLTALGFLVGALLVGLFVTRRVFRVAVGLRAPHVLGALSIGLCLLFSAASQKAGLAAIIGAFAAGLVLDDVSVKPFGEDSMKRLENFVGPIVALFAPLFFARTGMGVRLAGLSSGVVLFALALTAVAIVGKLAAGLGVRGNGDKLTVGLGMVPRGEVGLIFADAGSKIVVGGIPLIGNQTYASIVLMVILTTIVTPPLLARRIEKRRSLSHP